jgi:hypothetical protein
MRDAYIIGMTIYTGVIRDSRDRKSKWGPESQYCIGWTIFDVRMELLKFLTENPDAKYCEKAYIEDSNGKCIEVVKD